MAFEHDILGHGDAATTPMERGPAPGKRMMTDRLQRKSASPPPAPTASSSPEQRSKDNGLSCDQSFLDSIVHGPVQRRADGGAASSDAHTLAAGGMSGGAGGAAHNGASDATNQQTRIIALSVDSEGTKLTIGAGTRHGVTAPMQCRLVSKTGATLGNVTIEDVADTVSHAHTHKTPDQIQEVDHVIINAAHAPAAHDLSTRILGISVVDDGVRLAIGAGSAHGVRPGMAVDLVRESGRTIERVTVRDVHERTSFARWEGTQDAVREISRVVVNPSTTTSNDGGPVQRRAGGDAASSDVHALAARGTSGAGGALPFLGRIQSAFGAHDVSHVQAHTDGYAEAAARGMGAHAFATGDHVAFAGAPDLHTAAHEAAHIVQQRAGVQLKGGVGEAGDAYEQHADAVADAVVRGESAEALLDQMAPSSGGGSGVQQQAVQLDEDGMQLGAAGRPDHVEYERMPVHTGLPKARLGGSGRIIDEPAPDPSTAGKVISGTSNAFKLGVAAMPHIKAAFEAIQTIKGIWDLLQPGGGKGETKQLPEAISGFNKLELDRVIRYAVAEKYIEEAFEIGLRHGVHFDKWQNGNPPDAAAATPTAGAPTTPPQKESAPPDAVPFINALQGLAVDDLKDRALQELKAKVAANTKRMEPVSWWWNGANERGKGEPPNFHGMGGDRETWGKITIRLAGAKIPEGTPAGIPEKARNFGIIPKYKLVSFLGWFNAGRVETETHEDSFDDLELRIAETSFNEAANHPVGAHHIAVEFIWDDSNTNVDLDVTFAPESWTTRLENIATEKTPKT
jgi:hypothetical protein